VRKIRSGSAPPYLSILLIHFSHHSTGLRKPCRVQNGTHLVLESKLSACLFWVALFDLSEFLKFGGRLLIWLVWGLGGDWLWVSVWLASRSCTLWIRTDLKVGSPGSFLVLVIQT